MENELNIIDRFCYKLLIGTFVLFAIIVLDYFSIVNFEKIREKTSTHWNMLNVVTLFNGDNNFLNIIDLDDTVTVSKEAYFEKDKIEKGYIIKTGSYNAVEVYKVGVVVQITKEDNHTYSVIVKGIDDYEYKYSNLRSIDVGLYKLVKSGEIIGSASSNDKTHYFNLSVSHKGNYIDVFNS